MLSHVYVINADSRLSNALEITLPLKLLNKKMIIESAKSLPSETAMNILYTVTIWVNSVRLWRGKHPQISPRRDLRSQWEWQLERD